MAPPVTARELDVSGLRHVPDAETWRALSPGAREAFIAEVTSALSNQVLVAPEGRPHGRAKSRALDQLGHSFARTGRRIYLASELPILYPGERGFAPDIMAVLDVDDPGDADERMAWVTADEGKGLDLALKVHYSGDRGKDFVDNVADYARLGIPEYFVYDRKQQILPPDAAGRPRRVLEHLAALIRRAPSVGRRVLQPFAARRCPGWPGRRPARCRARRRGP